jgi:peptidoglycan/LPS O-acetylase OafA/YrhL
MLLASLWLLMQTETRATQPNFFVPVVLILLVAGVLGWLIAAVLGFQRARAFGPSARWFTFCAVCLIIYHLQFLLLAFAVYSDADTALNVGAFFNLFIVIGAICAIMGFVKLTNPE